MKKIMGCGFLSVLGEQHEHTSDRGFVVDTGGSNAAGNPAATVLKVLSSNVKDSLS
jgi:hypothetical protein